MASFRDLRAWQEAMALAKDVYRVVDRWPPQYAFLADQMRRAARSVHADIAEGNGKSSRRDYVRLLHDARGSLQELESDVESICDTQLVSPKAGDKLRAGVRRTGRLLDALIRSLKAPPNDPPARPRETGPAG
jgi:four helix bundle protein